MAFNGSGTFLRLYSWIADAAAAIKISSTRMDAEMDGMATGLSNCVTKDGQTTPTANLPMGGFRHTGAGDSTSLSSYPSTQQVQNGAITYDATDTGVANAYVAGLAPAPTAYVDGMDVYLKIVNSNTGASTINLNALGVKNIKTPAGADPSANAILAGQIAYFKYNGINFLLMTEANLVHNNGNETIAGNKTFTGAIIEAQVTIAAATTTNVLSAGANSVLMTGSAGAITITSFGTSRQAGAKYHVTSTGTSAHIITHNATSLICESAAPITVAQGDSWWIEDLGANNCRLFGYTRANGTSLIASSINRQEFITAGANTWTKPSGYSANALVVLEAVAGGGGGGRGNAGAFSPGGGGGGGYSTTTKLLSELGATETITVGPGGIGAATTGNGAVGGNTTIGTLLTAYGGGGGGGDAVATSAGGGGGGDFAAGGSAVGATVGAGGAGIATTGGGTGGAVGAVGARPNSPYGGGGGGGAGGAAGTGNGAQAHWGGGGGAAGNAAHSGGSSINGGNGGDNTMNGSQPGGGGGGHHTAPGGNGGAGRARITVYG